MCCWLSQAVIAIVGRPNVGKSTLFNRIARQRLAIVEDTPGVTRDRLYANGEWLGRQFLLIDTGGITDARDTIQTQIRNQVEMALEEADAIIMVVDGRESLTSSDHQVATLLRKTNKPVVLAINKIDNFSEYTDPEIYGLGLGEPVLVSAEHGKNIGDLLDLVLGKIPGGENDADIDSIRVTFVGRPNVGKSSLVNALLGQSRVIVSAEPGTTRDAIDTPLIAGDKHYLLVDTAGIRRKSKVEEAVEYYSVLRALKAVERSDVVILVLDATALMTSDEVADLDFQFALVVLELFDGHVGFGLEACVDDDEVVFDTNDFSRDHFASAHVGALQRLLEHGGEGFHAGSGGLGLGHVDGPCAAGSPDAACRRAAG